MSPTKARTNAAMNGTLSKIKSVIKEQKKKIKENGERENKGREKIIDLTGMHRMFRIYIYPIHTV